MRNSERVTVAAEGAAGFLLASILSLDQRAQWAFPPRLVLLYAFLALLVLNILVFSLNLLLTMGKLTIGKAEGFQTEEQLEEVMVPALKGEPNAVVGPLRTVLAALAIGSLGAMLGALVVLAVRKL